MSLTTSLFFSSFAADNDMDLGTLQNNLNNTMDNVYEDDLEPDCATTLSNSNPLSNSDQANLLTGGGIVKRSQPLLIQANRYVEIEQSIMGMRCSMGSEN